LDIDVRTDYGMIENLALQFSQERRIYPFVAVTRDTTFEDTRNAFLGSIENEDLVLRLFYTLNLYSVPQQQLLLSNFFCSPRTIVRENDDYFAVINVNQLAKHKEYIWSLNDEFKETTHLFNALFHTLHIFETEVILNFYQEHRLDPDRILNSDIFSQVAMRTQFLYSERVGDYYTDFVELYFTYKLETNYDFLGETLERKKNLMLTTMRLSRAQSLMSVKRLKKV